MKTKLFVICQRGRNQFWSCNAEHGSGWTDCPKQSFTPSELIKEIRRLIDEKWFTDIEVRELRLTDSCNMVSMPDRDHCEASDQKRCGDCGRRF